jgi:hypothetical protein
VERRSRVIFRGRSFVFAQLAVHPNREGGMGSRSMFCIAFSFATSFGANLKLCSKRISASCHCDLNVTMKDLHPAHMTLVGASIGRE